MKFDCGETTAEWGERRSKWHKRYAWYPVRVGSHDCRWLEYVERRSIWSWEYHRWEYRLCQE
jgi:hypothetical protein